MRIARAHKAQPYRTDSARVPRDDDDDDGDRRTITADEWSGIVDGPSASRSLTVLTDGRWTCCRQRHQGRIEDFMLGETEAWPCESDLRDVECSAHITNGQRVLKKAASHVVLLLRIIPLLLRIPQRRCYVHRSRDSQCLSTGRTIPQNCPSNTWFLGTTQVSSQAHLDWFSCLQGSRTWPTNKHTDRPRYSVYSNRLHLAITSKKAIISYWTHPTHHTSSVSMILDH